AQRGDYQQNPDNAARHPAPRAHGGLEQLRSERSFVSQSSELELRTLATDPRPVWIAIDAGSSSERFVYGRMASLGGETSNLLFTLWQMTSVPLASIVSSLPSIVDKYVILWHPGLEEKWLTCLRGLDSTESAIHTMVNVDARLVSEGRIVSNLVSDERNYDMSTGDTDTVSVSAQSAVLSPTGINGTRGKAIPANAKTAGEELTATTDQACAGFPLPGELRGLDDEPVQNMTCYTGGLTVNSNYQMCDVTNRKILDMLPGRPPQVTFSCDRPSEECNFQFWIGQKESFYCALDTCTSTLQHAYDYNITQYECQNIKCNCIPGRMLCGEEGSVDIGDFLTEEIKGPAQFTCKTGQGCQFEEPAMNQLINDIFGDNAITLKCDGGECLHYTQVPGYVRPERPDNSLMVGVSAALAGLFFLVASAAFWYMGRASKHPEGFGQIRLPADEAQRLMTDH
ncbi:hypothetical protein FRB90_008635, partial [Tulasnella sp. 427]